MKQCNICKQRKEANLDNFHKNKKLKDGLNNKCKECNKKSRRSYYYSNREKEIEKRLQFRDNNREKEREYSKQYRETNKENISQKQKEYYKKHREKLCQQKRHRDLLPLEFQSSSKYRKELELYEEIKESEGGNVEIKCTYCGLWFEPTRQQISDRIRAVNGEFTVGTENRLYCSNKCKENCPIYGQELHFKHQKQATSREVQPELRQLVFQRDDYTCQKCGFHKDELEVGIHCHHLEGIRWNPLESADEDACITLCEKCHNEAHYEIGCRYIDLKCNAL